jgi:tetratricopeptide (TPR) repeat protein
MGAVGEHSSRILDLRRRAQSDPAPFVLAQLADEYGRAGQHDEAIECCRTILARHPAYSTARVVLGRALAARGRFDEAAAEFEQILEVAPDHLAAMQELAAVYERLHRPADALRCYRGALVLSRQDRRLEEAVTRLAAVVPADRRAPDVSHPPHPVAVDFDDLLARLGHPDQPAPPMVEALLTHPERLLAAGTPPETRQEAQVPIARERPEAPPDERGCATGGLSPREAATLRQLERWLVVLTRDRAV